MRILVLFLFLVAVAATPAAYAEITQHQNFDREFIGLSEDNKAIYQDKIYFYDRIQNNQGDWLDYIINEDENIIQVESAQGSLVYNKANCAITFYNDIRINPQSEPEIYSDSFTVKRSTDGSGVWQNVNQINNAACLTNLYINEDSIEIVGNKSRANVGQFLIKYIKPTGEFWKVQLEPTNNSTLTDQRFGVTETLEVPRFISIGNDTQKDLANFNNTVFDRAFLENHKGQLINFRNNVLFDFALGWASVEKVTVYYFGGNTAKLAIDYFYNAPILLPDETLIIDPVLTINGSNTVIQLSRQQTGAGTTCGTGSTYNRVSALALGTDVSSGNTWCRWTTMEVPLTSIDNDAVITDVDFQGKIQSSGTATAKTCDYVDYGTTDPDSDSDATVYSNAYSNSAYVTGDGNCTSLLAGQTWTVDLGANADTDVQNAITTTDRFTLAIRYNPAEREASEINRTFSSTYSGIVVTYQVPLDPPTNFACNSDGDEVICTWDAPSPATGVETYYIGRSLDNSTFPAGNKTSTGNVTSAVLNSFRANQLYYLNVTAGNSGFNSTADYTSVTTDDYPNAPGTSDTAGTSFTSIIVRWLTPTNNGNDAINGYRIEFFNHTDPNGWEVLSANTTSTTTNANHTGLHTSQTYTYRVKAGNGVGFGLPSNNMTATPHTITTGTLTITGGNVGDTENINATISITAGSPEPFTVSQVDLYRNNTLVESNTTDFDINSVGESATSRIWYQITNDFVNVFHVKALVSNVTGTVTLSSSSNITVTREYDPNYNPSITDPATLGDVNATISRFDDQDGVQLKVNRINVASGETWTLNCIAQTNAEAATTRNQSLSWPGAWRNYSSTGYGNTTWTGFSGTHAYITCVNPPSIIFTTTSFTNSSLALFGIQIFDESYGAMLGVPVGVFFLVLVAGMANKRTAPTFIIVVLGMAGVLSTLLFFTVNPLVWGLALVTGLLGALVNQKVF